MTTVVLLLFALFCVVLARPDRQFNLLGRSFRQLQRQNAALNPQYETRWFNTRLDHFNAHVLPYEFPMRYLINSTFFDVKNGPVFFYTGNEGDIELFAANTGLVWEWAAEFNALIVFAEHRYYGQSLPFGNASFTGSNPGYLSVAQVLSDYTALVSALQIEFHPDGQSRSPVIAFGGSYGGMLSAWWRVRYPHAVDGALAASAPILQFENVTDSMVFNHLASQDYVEQLMHESRTALGTCDMAWSAALNAIQDMANNSSAWSDLSSTFTLCSPLQSAANVSTLVNWLTSGLVDQAMTDYPAPTSFLQPIPAWPVNVSCRVFDQCLSSVKSQNKLDSIVRCAAQAIQIYYNGTGVTKCNDILSDATADLGEQGWDYQSCTEMVMPIGQYGVPNDMFVPSPWSDAAFTLYCQQKWNVTPDFGWAQREFGGDALHASSNIVFSNGELDPWRGGGVTRSISDTMVAILIPEGAHHLDLRASDPSDPLYVVSARMQEKALIQTFIDQAPRAALEL